MGSNLFSCCTSCHPQRVVLEFVRASHGPLGPRPRLVSICHLSDYRSRSPLFYHPTMYRPLHFRLLYRCRLTLTFCSLYRLYPPTCSRLLPPTGPGVVRASSNLESGYRRPGVWRPTGAENEAQWLAGPKEGGEACEVLGAFLTANQFCTRPRRTAIDPRWYEQMVKISKKKKKGKVQAGRNGSVGINGSSKFPR